MSRKSFEKFIDYVTWAKVIKKAETATKGQCLFPSRSEGAKLNDTNCNYRLDAGAFKDGLRHIVMQPNINAEDRTVRKLVEKNSHAVLAEAALDPKNDPDAKKTKEQLAADFEKRCGEGGKGGKS